MIYTMEIIRIDDSKDALILKFIDFFESIHLIFSNI